MKKFVLLCGILCGLQARAARLDQNVDFQPLEIRIAEKLKNIDPGLTHELLSQGLYQTLARAGLSKIYSNGQISIRIQNLKCSFDPARTQEISAYRCEMNASSNDEFENISSTIQVSEIPALRLSAFAWYLNQLSPNFMSDETLIKLACYQSTDGKLQHTCLWITAASSFGGREPK